MAHYDKDTRLRNSGLRKYGGRVALGIHDELSIIESEPGRLARLACSTRGYSDEGPGTDRGQPER